MLVAMTCTMAISAPMTIVFGVILALHEDVGLSIILVVAIPAAAILLGFIVGRMVPAFRLMQIRLDGINRILREQITGIRVIRAFVREPQERDAIRASRTPSLTATALRAGRLMAWTFPTVNLVVNLASVAVLWLGASRIDSGHLQIGSLVAYLSYLIQILMAVMLATFTISMVPRASVSAGRIQEVIETDSTVVAPAHPDP